MFLALLETNAWTSGTIVPWDNFRCLSLEIIFSEWPPTELSLYTYYECHVVMIFCTILYALAVVRRVSIELAGHRLTIAVTASHTVNDNRLANQKLLIILLKLWLEDLHSFFIRSFLAQSSFPLPREINEKPTLLLVPQEPPQRFPNRTVFLRSTPYSGLQIAFSPKKTTKGNSSSRKET